ncbi:phage integrase family protein [Micromonospora palomenae]|uniref:Phage integrase family protein n=1 Tax=Micromonospora palomenae TaxID=1461247 RepID=A0A561WT60_9ACTN|nr:phage integrase family protein [Micromonospora palomenae]
MASFIRRLAKAAGLPGWKQISPHSCRQAWNTIARKKGADLEDRQRAMGHADPRTAQRYDRDKDSLDRPGGRRDLRQPAAAHPARPELSPRASAVGYPAASRPAAAVATIRAYGSSRSGENITVPTRSPTRTTATSVTIGSAASVSPS